MTDHPTVMTPAEIDAWRRGDKTQHRMPLDVQPPCGSFVHDENGVWWHTYMGGDDTVIDLPFAPGDRLVVLEEFSIGHSTLKQFRRRMRTHHQTPVFRDQLDTFKQYRNMPWHPAEDMPEWASRYRIPITAIKGIERVQDISEDDARAEGVESTGAPLFLYRAYTDHPGAWKNDGNPGFPQAYESFMTLWDARHGSGAWKRNDWVVVLELEHE